MRLHTNLLNYICTMLQPIEKKIRCLLIDADVMSLRECSRMVINSPRLELVNTCKTGRSAVNILKDYEVDLVIMNPALPDANGFDLIAALEVQPEVIIISDKPDYAFFAYRIDACDYRLKPLTTAKLDESLDRVFMRMMLKKVYSDAQKDDNA
jgi:two-component system, LytTR family, response regulator